MQPLKRRPSPGAPGDQQVKLFDEFAVACALNLDDGGEVIGMIGSKAEVRRPTLDETRASL